MRIFLIKNKDGTKELAAHVRFEKNLETGNYESVLFTSKGTTILPGESVQEHVEKYGEPVVIKN